MAILNVRSPHLHLHLHLPAALPGLALPRLPGLAAMYEALVTRRQLARLDERMLKDIGLSRADALAEAARAPWDLGPPRRC